MREIRSNFWKRATAFGALAATLIAASTAPVAAQVNGKIRRATPAKIAAAAPFTPGNVVVYRVGTGTGSLGNTGNAVFLDEFTPNGTPAQSLALPTTASGSNRQLIASGTATSEGFLSRSVDGRYLLVTGYARDLGGTTNITTTTSTDVPRVVGRIDAAGTIDTTTALTDAFSGGNIRSVASADGTNLYVGGSAGGSRLTTVGATVSTSISATPASLRQIGIYDNQLYIATQSGTTRIAAVGTGLPTASNQTTTNIPGAPSSTASPYGFFFADLSQSVAGVDTLYVADDLTGLLKFSLVNGSWTASGTIGADADDYRGLTGVVNGTSVTLYATRRGGSSATGGGELVSIVDASGYNANITASPTLLATAAANTAFRGVALAPVAGTVVTRRAPLDFNGDNKTDFSVVRDQDGQVIWYNAINGTNEVRGVAWGLPTDLFVPADFDGDNRADIAVWRGGGDNDPTRSLFFVLQSNTNTVRIEALGRSSDDPSVVGDYDGDRKADLAVFRPNLANTTAQWIYRPSGTPGAADVTVNFGLGFDYPAPGDYDGDGKNDFVTQREINGLGYFNLLKSFDNTTETVQWGLPSDFIVPGDYDGDGKNDLCVSRPDQNDRFVFYILTRTGAIQYQTWGLRGDDYVPGDYNGDGRTDFAVWRPSSTNESSIFYVRPTNGAPDIFYQWGAFGDVPVANFQVQ